jgi:anti-sigma factor RsiW
VSRYEELSRLLDGDLPPEEASALRERIARDPQLKAEWEAMQALPHLLRHLPEEQPPAELNEAIAGAGAAAPRAARARPWVAVAVSAIVSAAAVAMFAWSEPAEILLADGSQLVEGDVRVLAGDRRVDVDGLALVTVEPPAGWAGVDGAKGAGAAASSLSGAVVTVTVFEGTATSTSAGGARERVSAGQTKTFGVAEGGSSGSPVVSSAAGGPSDAALHDRIAQLEGEIEKLRFEQALARGRLASLEGEPIEWPSDLPAAARPDEFEKAFRAALATDPRYEILEMDCAEFPCLVSFRMNGGGADGEKAVQSLVRSFNDAQFGGQAHALQWVSRTSDAADSDVYVGFGLIPDGWHTMAELDTRLRYRMDSLMSAVEPRLEDSP